MYHAQDTDMDILLQTGPNDNMFHFVTHLGRQDIENHELYYVSQLEGEAPFISSGAVSEMWVNTLETSARDPTLSSFILNVFQLVRGNLAEGFPGLAGRMFNAYTAFRESNPSVYATYGSSPNIQVITEEPYNIQIINAPDSERALAENPFALAHDLDGGRFRWMG